MKGTGCIFRVKQIWLLCTLIVVVLFHMGQSSAGNSANVREVLSIKVGSGTNNIKNQFKGVTLDPYNGFAVDSKGNIIISDTMNHRIMHFSKGAKLLEPFTVNDKYPFSPETICVDKDDITYAHNSEKQEILVFSSDGEMLFSFDPAAVFNYKYKTVSIMALSCDRTMIKVIFGVQEPKIIRPVYQDEYDQDFKLISRKVYDDQVAYYNAIEETNKAFEKHFEDSKGNVYGYPIVKDWYDKFLPLQKYSHEGELLSTIDGPLLTKHTKYKIYDYYTRHGWSEMKGKDFMIVNWYVTPNGDIYALLANKDYVKVLRIEWQEDGK